MDSITLQNVSGLLSRMSRWFEARPITQARVRTAYSIAVAIDLLQFLLGPLGWVGADEALDVLAMTCTWRLLGFHPLLLPTFVLEFVPLTDMLPTWVGCVALVVAIRRRQQINAGAAPDASPPIDVTADRVE